MAGPAYKIYLGYIFLTLKIACKTFMIHRHEFYTYISNFYGASEFYCIFFYFTKSVVINSSIPLYIDIG